MAHLHEADRDPADATTASLLVYAYESDGKTENVVRYDNFHLIELPPIHNRYYLVSDPQTNFVDPESKSPSTS
jgi:hypothetical protein